MIIEEQTILDINKQLQNVLAEIKTDELEPYELGKLMRSINSVLQTSIEYVEKHIPNLQGGQRIKDAILENKKKYNLISDEIKDLLDDNQDYEESQTKAFAIVQELNDLKAKIDSVKLTIVTEKERYNSLNAEYQELVKKLENWRDALDDIDGKHTENLKIHGLHFAANEVILQNITKAGGGYAKEQMNSIVSEIREKLNVFDDNLKTIVQSRDKLSIAALENEKHHSLN